MPCSCTLRSARITADPDGENARMPPRKRAARRPSPAPVGRPAVPARRDLRRVGHQLLAVLQRRRGRRAVPARATTHDARRGARRADRGRRPLLARLPARRPPGPALRLPGPRAVGPGRAGCGATRPSCSSTRTPRRSTARSTGTRRASPTTSTTPTEPNTADSAPHVPRGRRQRPVLRLGQRPPAGPRHARHDHLRGPRQGPDDAATPACPRRSAARTRRSPTRRSSSTSPRSASPPSS